MYLLLLPRVVTLLVPCKAVVVTSLKLKLLIETSLYHIYGLCFMERFAYGYWLVFLLIQLQPSYQGETLREVPKNNCVHLFANYFDALV